MLDPTDVDADKRELRRAMHQVVREIADRADASAAICERLARLDASATAETVMVYEALTTEVDPASFAWWCRERGANVVAPVPEPAAALPVDPTEVDLVVVPGLAFATDGRRLGRGGGWYDGFLAGTRDDCVLVGICHDDQLLETIPTEPHDVRMTIVVTPTRTLSTSA